MEIYLASLTYTSNGRRHPRQNSTPPRHLRVIRSAGGIGNCLPSAGVRLSRRKFRGRHSRLTNKVRSNDRKRKQMRKNKTKTQKHTRHRVLLVFMSHDHLSLLKHVSHTSVRLLGGTEVVHIAPVKSLLLFNTEHRGLNK